MKTVTLLVADSGHFGGIESRCLDYGVYSSHDNLMLILWGDGFLDEQMLKRGIRVKNLHASHSNVFATVRSVLKVIEEEKADVVIAMHTAPMSHLCLMHIKRKHPEIRTFAYSPMAAEDVIRIPDERRAWLRKAVFNASFRRADRVVAISKAVKASLIDMFGLPGERIAVIYNGTDLRRFPPKEYGEDDGVCKMIFVGRLIEEKGVQVTLRAIAQLSDRSRFRLRIVGDGAYRDTLEKLADELELRENVEFMGSRSDIPELLAQADVFVHMPVWEEGFGIAVAEALSAGLICVCARSGAMPEIINDPSVGYLVEKGNPNELARVLERIAEMTTEEKRSMSEAAHKRAEAFSIDTYVKNLDALVSGTFEDSVE